MPTKSALSPPLMSALFRALGAAVRGVLSHRRRFALPALAVVLSVACVSGSLLYGQSVSDVMDRALTQARPDVSVEVRPDPSADPEDGGAQALDDNLLHRLEALPGAAAARGTLEGSTFVVGAEGTPVGDMASAAGVNYVPQQPGPAGKGGEDPRYPLAEGHGPRGPGEIALDRATAERAKARVGQRVRVVVEGEVRTARLVGVFTAHDPRLASGGTLTAFDADTAARLFAPAPDTYASLTLTAARGTSDAALAERAGKLLPSSLQTVTRAELDAETAARPDSQKLSTLLLIFAGIALLVSTFLVANTFTMLSAARAREHALLRAIGATRGYIERLVLTEAVLIGALASALGHLLGIGVAEALGTLFDTAGAPRAALRPLAAMPLLAAFAVGIGVTALSAYLPARRASAVPPVAALRTVRPPTPDSLRRRGIIGACVTGFGALLVLAAIQDNNLFAAAVPVLLIGLIILTPLTALGVTRVLRAPLTRLAGVRGTLAVANARRNPRRTAATATALMVGLALVAAITVAVSSLSHMATRDAEAAMVADIRVKAVDFADIGADVPGRVARVPGAEAATPLVQGDLRMRGDELLPVVGVDPHTVERAAGLKVVRGSLDDLGHGIAVTSETARAHGWKPGSRVSGALGEGARSGSLPVVAVYEGPEDLGPALVPAAELSGETAGSGEGSGSGPGSGAASGTGDGSPGAFIESVLVKTAPGQAGTVKEDIREALDNPVLLVQDRADAGEEAARPFAPLLDIMYAMLSVAVLIGALGVVNTMSMAVFERVREIGVLRALGLDRRQVGSVLRIESVVVSLLGSGLGLLAGAVLGAAAVASEEGAVLVMPWGRLGAFFAASVAIGVLASLWPGRQAARTPMLRALSADTE
ncbi:ABC transporter permease [Streptomyces sp. NPDC054796]